MLERQNDHRIAARNVFRETGRQHAKGRGGIGFWHAESAELCEAQSDAFSSGRLLRILRILREKPLENKKTLRKKRCIMKKL